MRYPTRLLTDDEQVLHTFRPHWRVLLVPLAWAMLIAAAGGFAVAALERRFHAWIVLAGLVLWLAVAARRIVTWWFTHYVLTSARIIVRHGMLARRGTEIPLENVTNVLFSQRIVERLLGYGDVLVESAGRRGRTRLSDIPHPQDFQTEIYRARERRGATRAATGDVVGRLQALADLRERGHLSDDEFAAQKRTLLGGPHGASPDTGRA